MPPAPKVACRKCGNLVAKTGRKRHENGCGETKPTFVCSECPNVYKTKQGLKVHFKEKHATTETHECSECVKTFDSKHKLRNHFDQYHTNKFLCKCGKNHASAQNLNNHILRMTEEGNTGHEPKIKKVVVKLEAEVSKKRKAVEMDPVETFFDAIRDRINRPDPTNPLCQSKKKLCTTTRLSHGFPGGHQKYCSNHGDEVPGLVDLGPLCKYVGCAKRAHPFIVTNTRKLNFCADHIKQLIRDGLPDPARNISAKDYGKKCIEEGCDKRTSFDSGRYCQLHSPTKRSDDTRVCEEPGCETRPSVGYLGEKQRWCGKHKQHGMVPYGLCVEPGCDKRASYGVVGGKHISCAGHKKDHYVLLGGTMCAMACCSTTSDGLQAVFFHPDHEDETSEFFGKRICRFGRRVLIEDALMHNDIAKLNSLLAHFKMDRVLTLNAQSAFRFECESKYHRFLKDCVDIVFDEQVEKGPKVVGALRPDIFYKWCVGGVNYGIHIEYDENGSHEDDLRRLKCIAENADCFDNVYVIRVQGGHGSKNPVCERVAMENFAYFRVTGEGRNVAANVADAVVERIKWIEEGLGPCEDRPSKIGL